MKNIEINDLKEFVKTAKSWADICRYVEIVPSGDNYTVVKRLLLKNDIHFEPSGEPWNKGIHYKIKQYSDIREALTENSTYRNVNSLRKRLIKEGLKLNQCEVCGISGEEVSLELHHINGSHFDNRLENLQILCPNCHSKTENFRGKNIKFLGERGLRHLPAQELILTEEVRQREEEHKLARRKEGASKIKLEDRICPVCGKVFHPRDSTQKYCSVECYREENKSSRPSFIQLIQDFKELKSFVQVGKKYNVTDNAVRKWCKLYGIPERTNEVHLFIENMFK